MTSNLIRKALLASTAGASALWVMSGCAFAQAQPTDTASAPASAGKSPVLEEIVVTADRKNSFSADLVQAGSFRGARQLDTPLTVNVIPNQMLVSQQATGMLDALRNTAGVTQAQTTTVVYNNLSIRGIPVDNRANYRLNGNLPIINLVDLPVEDKERVEALKGASALYYGFTTPSGIINLTMKRPTKAPYLETDLFGNNFGAVGGHVDAGDTWGMFGARVNLLYGSVDSGIKYTRGTRELAAGAFDFRPTDRLTITFDAEYVSKVLNEPGVYRFSAAPTPTLANFYPSITLPPLLNPTSNFGPNWALNSANEANLLASASYKISDAWNIEIDAGRSQANRLRHFNTLNITNALTADGLLSIGLQRSHLQNQNLRAQVTGTFATGPFVHEVMFGASDNIKDQFQPTALTTNCAGGVAATAPAACAENAFSPKTFPETPMPAFTGDTTRIADIGLYGFDRVKYGEWLQLLGGIRYSDYTESDITTGKVTFKAKPTSYSGGVVVKPRPWASLYATYIEGLETTPPAGITAANAGAQLPATYSTQYEGGVKLEPRRGLLFQAAYFDIDRAATFINSSNVYVQDGRLKYRGVEMSLTGEITRDLSVYASAQFLDAETASGAATTYTYTNGTTSTTLNPALVFKSLSATLVGKFVENTPRTTLSVSGEFHLPMIKGATLTAGAYYTAARFINPQNEAQIPAYTLVDLGGSYTTLIADRSITFRINAENVGNVRYFASAGALIFAQGAPADVKFSIMAKF